MEIYGREKSIAVECHATHLEARMEDQMIISLVIKLYFLTVSEEALTFFYLFSLLTKKNNSSFSVIGIVPASVM